MKHQRAYTLVEVLVVMLIVVVVVSILVPVFSQGRAKAKTVVCISNLRQIHAAMMLYQSDYGEYPPNALDFPGLKAYYPTLLQCPSYAGMQKPGTRDYSLLGTMIPNAGPTSKGIDVEASKTAFRQCREKRGPEIPIAMDINHRGKILDMKDQVNYYFVLREGGAVERVSVSQALNRPKICDDTLLPSHYNL
jgi:prepilin-type N-terminal cleavage/methylation domain-containing protein